MLDFDAVVKAPFGGIGIRIDAGSVSEAVYLPASMLPALGSRPARHALAKEAVAQIKRYWNDPSFGFDLPLATRGTAFQQNVWRAISAIPSGATLSYGAIARTLRSGPRAVGGACGANWFSLIVPCHRVLAVLAHGSPIHVATAFVVAPYQALVEHQLQELQGSSVADLGAAALA